MGNYRLSPNHDMYGACVDQSQYVVMNDDYLGDT